MDYAAGQGLRSGSDPDGSSPALSGLLGGEPAKSGGNHSALSYDHVAKFFAKLKDRQASSADVYRLLILTAARVGKVLGASWSEIHNPSPDPRPSF